MASVNDGDARVPLTVELSQRLLSELQDRAATDGVTPEEMLSNLFVTAFRTPGLQFPFRSFSIPNEWAGTFIADGFRVLARKDGYHILAPHDGVSFEDAVASFQAKGLTEAEILEKAYS